MATYLRPPRIRHLSGNLSDDRETLSLLCACALHMSKGELRLLQFYAECQNGFRPSQQLVADKIGTDRRHIPRIRKQLEAHGVVLHREDVIFVDWSRIRLFSTLDPRMTRKIASVAPVSIEERPEQPDPDPDFFQFAPLQDVCSWFSSLNEIDFSRWKRKLRKYKPTPAHSTA